ncbi:hypothetical protein [Thermosinus carboxydivorans]|uniref:hypothetical protein n=1 Tax=Thermosinus carboxydivorans TaxID=261685 RepID=UPI000309B1E9|nr:hypothetical protein [Thermosinus carboxydivorans]
MGYHNNNWIDDTVWEFPRTGFWLIHILGAAFVFLAGMRFALRRAPIWPVLIFRLFRLMKGRS